MNLEIRFTLPNQAPQTIPVKERILIGTLMSNEVVIRAPGVEPIHAMIEVLEDGTEILTDLGSQTGVQLNGKQIEVESPLKIGDVIVVGDVKIDVLAYGASSDDNFQTATTRMPPQASSGAFNLEENTGVAQPTSEAKKVLSETQVTPPQEQSKPQAEAREPKPQSETRTSKPKQRVSSSSSAYRNTEKKGAMLFSPRNAKPSGDVLEVVSYWGDTVLDVDLFHPTYKGYTKATIGTPPIAHFLAGGKSDIKSHPLAELSPSGYKIKLLPDMQARIRKGGEVSDSKGKGTITLGKRDIAHVAHGAVKYFLMFVKPPDVVIPSSRGADPFIRSLMVLSVAAYFLTVVAIFFSEGKEDDDLNDDIWSIVNVPEKEQPPKPDLPKPKQEVAKAPPPPKTPPKPPKPTPKPPEPVPPKEVPKPPKVVEKPKQRNVPKPTAILKPKEKPRPQAAPKPRGGIAKTGKKPDQKLPGRKIANTKLGLSGGPKGGGKFRPSGGGRRKGNSKADVKGVEGVNNKKASGVNLSKLGVGAGLVLQKKGAGAIKTNFSNSAGGAGGGSGSASKTFGLGGPGSGNTLAVSGTGGAANNFGGFGGDGSGAGGSGGLGGSGINSGFGRGKGSGRVDVVVPASDPVIAGGLSQQEVQAVIRANLNQIRHCYEQLLQRSPSSQGKVKVSFVVQPNGRVGSAKIVSSDISDSVMRGCVTGKVKRWKFPNPRGGKSVTVNYPFVFNPL